MDSAMAEDSHSLCPLPFPGKQHAVPLHCSLPNAWTWYECHKYFLNDVGVTFWCSMFLMVTSALFLLILNLKPNFFILIHLAHWKHFYLLYPSSPQFAFLLWGVSSLLFWYIPTSYIKAILQLRKSDKLYIPGRMRQKWWPLHTELPREKTLEMGYHTQEVY